MSKKSTKERPTREQLAALAAQLADAPTVGNSVQARLWAEIGAAKGWTAMSPPAKSDFLARFSAAAC